MLLNVLLVSFKASFINSNLSPAAPPTWATCTIRLSNRTLPQALGVATCLNRPIESPTRKLLGGELKAVTEFAQRFSNITSQIVFAFVESLNWLQMSVLGTPPMVEAPEAIVYDDQPSFSSLQVAFLALQAVTQTIIICLIGYWAARKGILTRAAQINLSSLNVMVATPCLVFSKMASSLSLSTLVDVSVIPVLFVVMTGVSYLAGRACSRFFRFTERETKFVIAMAVFGNSNSLPVSVTIALANTLPMLRWPDIPGDNSDKVVSRGILYLLIFQQLGQMLRWSWGYNSLLAGQEDPNEESLPIVVDPSSVEPSQKTRVWRTFVSDLYQFMNPPLWAMLAAVIVASIPPAKYELYEKGGFVANTLGLAITQIGRTAIPLILLTLGANLAPTIDNGHLRKAPRHNEMVFASLFSRMVLPALVLLPGIALAVRYLGISIMDDPIFLVAMFLLTVSPPAIQLSQICQLNHVYELEMANILFWGYSILTLPFTIFIVVGSLRVLGWAGVLD